MLNSLSGRKEENMRRIVTGNKDGKSVFISDGMPPRVVRLESLPVIESTEIWATDDTATIPIQPGDPTVEMSSFVPGPTGTRFRFFRMPPLQEFAEVLEKADMAAVGQELLEKLPGLAEAMEPENFGMHTTDTVDYNIVLSGEIWLELDDGREVHLKPGDCVVQNGTRHAWKNLGSEACLIASIMIGAKRG
jgi:mannose-6-phosphate isomerase-like protein (cupin superfamily)